MAFPKEHIIPFYGSERPEMFEIERRCMDREGKVIRYLNEHLPKGMILDVGAGNGFTAMQLQQEDRIVVALEPNEGMINHDRNLVWINASATNIPLHSNSIDAAYATWAFFFPSFHQDKVDIGLKELQRVVKKGGKILIVDNAGDDEFSSLTTNSIGGCKYDWEYWKNQGFQHHIIHSKFIFDDVDEAQKLLGFYFGEKGHTFDKTEIEYRIVVYEGIV